LLLLWSLQDAIYWGAMTAIPKLYQSWAHAPTTGTSTFNLQVLLLLYAFELIGVSAFVSFQFGAYQTRFCLYVVGARLLGLTSLCLGLNLGYFLAASVCGMLHV